VIFGLSQCRNAAVRAPIAAGGKNRAARAFY